MTNSEMDQNPEHELERLVFNQGFVKLERVCSFSFADGYRIYVQNDLLLRVLSDRGQVDVQIGIVGQDEWFDLALVLQFLSLNDCSFKTSAHQLCEMFLEHISDVAVLFSKESYDETKRSLNRLERDRMYAMFPQLKLMKSKPSDK